MSVFNFGRHIPSSKGGLQGNLCKVIAREQVATGSRFPEPSSRYVNVGTNLRYSSEVAWEYPAIDVQIWA